MKLLVRATIVMSFMTVVFSGVHSPAFALSTSERSSRRPFVYAVDISSSTSFKDGYYNLWGIGDGLGRLPDGLAFTVPGGNAADVTTRIVESSFEEGGECSVSTKVRNGKVRVIVMTDLGVDSEYCDVAIILKDGRRAVMHIENVGT